MFGHLLSFLPAQARQGPVSAAVTAVTTAASRPGRAGPPCCGTGRYREGRGGAGRGRADRVSSPPHHVALPRRARCLAGGVCRAAPCRAVPLSLSERAASSSGAMSGNGHGYGEQAGEAAPELAQEAAPTTAPSVPAAFGLFSSDTKK